MGQQIPSDTQRCLKPFLWRNYLWPGIVAIAALAIIPWGAETFWASHRLLRAAPVESLFHLCLQLADPWAVVLAGALIWTLDRPRRRFLVYLLVGLILAGSLNAVLKEIGGRARPEWSIALDGNRLDDVNHFARDNPNLRFRTDKTDQWLLLSPNRPWFKDWFSSFPSGHACAAFGLMAFLSVLYPRARMVFLLFAVGCALARVRSSHHYLEDVMFGGALGWSVVVWVCSWRWPLGLGLWIGGVRVRAVLEPIHPG
jgi:membrane-associated phospholipid phosphatase